MAKKTNKKNEKTNKKAEQIEREMNSMPEPQTGADEPEKPKKPRKKYVEKIVHTATVAGVEVEVPLFKIKFEITDDAGNVELIEETFKSNKEARARVKELRAENKTYRLDNSLAKLAVRLDKAEPGRHFDVEKIDKLNVLIEALNDYLAD